MKNILVIRTEPVNPSRLETRPLQAGQEAVPSAQELKPSHADGADVTVQPWRTSGRAPDADAEARGTRSPSPRPMPRGSGHRRLHQTRYTNVRSRRRRGGAQSWRPARPATCTVRRRGTLALRTRPRFPEAGAGPGADCGDCGRPFWGVGMFQN